MASLFKDLPESAVFWVPASNCLPVPNQIIHTGLLSICTKSPSPEFKTTSYSLTKTHLYQSQDPTPNSPFLWAGAVRWVTILPFLEQLESEVRFGFSVKFRDEKIDFFARSEEELDGWLKNLETISVLQDIEEDYEINQVIGSGGQSTVYAGIDRETGKTVAIKCFDKVALRESPKRFTALVHEIEVLRDIAHPRIVGLYRVYESLTQVSLVMEHIPGQELFQCLSLTGRFTEEETKGFMRNMLEVLKYMEEHSVVHRDLKPENIILTDPGNKSEFKLIDFGFATKYPGRDLFDTCGSPGYVAPEIILKNRHGPTVDIYSAGIIFYILLCGYSPFYSTKKAEVIKKNARSEIHFTGIWTQVDAKLIKMIKVMTSFNPSWRLNAQQLLAYLAGSASSVDIVFRRSSMMEMERFPPIAPSKVPTSPKASPGQLSPQGVSGLKSPIADGSKLTGGFSAKAAIGSKTPETDGLQKPTKAGMGYTSPSSGHRLVGGFPSKPQEDRTRRSSVKY